MDKWFDQYNTVDVITNPCPNFNGVLIEVPLNK